MTGVYVGQGWPRSHEVVDGYETVDVAPREDS